jgi:hypothetical protein
MKTSIDNHAWACGRTNQKSNPSMAECYWNVIVNSIIAEDPKTYEPDFFFRWEAFTNDSCRIRFEQENNRTNNYYNYCSTVAECRKDWNAFASRNNLQHFGYVPYMDNWHSKFFDAKPEKDYDFLNDHLGALNNEYAVLANLLICEHGFLGGGPISRTEKQRRIKDMKKKGDWQRMKEIEKAAKTRDIQFVIKYNDYGRLNQLNPVKYPLKKAIA